MKIRYNVRETQFVERCQNAIRENSAILDRGEIVQVDLGAERGYKGKIVVTIDPSDSVFFETNWGSTDVTRFPARIKAAATALFNAGRNGTYELSHTDGVIDIQALEAE